MDSFVLPHHSRSMMRTLGQHEMSILFDNLKGKDDVINPANLTMKLFVAGLLPTYLTREELNYILQRVASDHDFREINPKAFAIILTAIGTLLPLNFAVLDKWIGQEQVDRLERSQLKPLGVCLLIQLLVTKCIVGKPNNSSLCLPEDLRPSKALDQYPFPYTFQRLSLMQMDKLHQSPVLDNLNMRIMMILQSPLVYIYKAFSKGDDQLDLDNFADGLTGVGLIPTYCTPEAFREMVVKLQRDFGTPSGDKAVGMTPVFVDPDRMDVDSEGFSFILNGLASILHWNLSVLGRVLGNLPETPYTLHALKLCFLIQWIYTKERYGKVTLGPNKCLNQIRRESGITKDKMRPGSLDENPLIPLVHDDTVERLEEEARRVGVSAIRRHQSRLDRPPAPLPLPPAPERERRFPLLKNIPLSAHHLWFHVVDYLQKHGIIVMPKEMANKLPKTRVGNYFLREDLDRVAIVPRNKHEDCKLIVKTYLILRGAEKFFDDKVPMPLPPLLQEVYDFIVKEIRARKWCVRDRDGKSMLGKISRDVLNDVKDEFPELKEFLVPRPGGACQVF